MVKSKTTREDINTHKQTHLNETLSLEESKKKIEKVLARLNNLSEEEGGEPKE